MQRLHISVRPDPKSVDFSFRYSLKDRNRIVTCKLLVLKRPTISQVFQFRYVCGIFFVNHSAPPSKRKLTPKAPTVQLIAM